MKHISRCARNQEVTAPHSNQRFRSLGITRLEQLYRDRVNPFKDRPDYGYGCPERQPNHGPQVPKAHPMHMPSLLLRDPAQRWEHGDEDQPQIS
jgi:hypothetical protein